MIVCFRDYYSTISAKKFAVFIKLLVNELIYTIQVGSKLFFFNSSNTELSAFKHTVTI